MIEQKTLLIDRIVGRLGRGTNCALGVAVSGGSDSLGLLVLLADWARETGRDLFAATVDHGLRPEAAQEAYYVAGVCRDLGVPHETLRWHCEQVTGNLPDQARRARYRLLAEWARCNSLGCIAIAHTLDDQAETFLMRLAREAGVDGLAAMVPHWQQNGATFCRPTLGVERRELRDVLRERGIDWIDDPTNSDSAYDRPRARMALAALKDVGISARGLSNVAQHLAEVRTSLYWYVFLAAQSHVRFAKGDAYIARKGFRTLTRDVARRLLQELLKWISGAEYAPRGRSVELMLESIRGGTGMTLHGCVMTVMQDELHLTREERAVADLRVPADRPWDARWQLDGPWPDDVEIGCLGQTGLLQCPEWHECGMPEVSLRASPAVWRNDHLVAAPLADFANGWQATLLRDDKQFFAAVLAH